MSRKLALPKQHNWLNCYIIKIYYSWLNSKLAPSPIEGSTNILEILILQYKYTYCHQLHSENKSVKQDSCQVAYDMAWILFIPLLKGSQGSELDANCKSKTISFFTSPMLILLYLDWKIPGQAPRLYYALSWMQIIGTAPNATVKANNNALLIKRHLETLWLVRAWFCQLVPCPVSSA